jgi:hypothetical protein
MESFACFFVEKHLIFPDAYKEWFKLQAIRICEDTYDKKCIFAIDFLGHQKQRTQRLDWKAIHKIVDELCDDLDSENVTTF